MRRTLSLLAALLFMATGVAYAAQTASFDLDKDYDELTPAEHTAAKRAARTQDIPPFVACADPGNMPMSNRDGKGYQNRIIKLLAKKMNTTVSFFWRPYLERGLTRETFNYDQCNVLLGMPVGYEGILETLPLFRTTYVLAYRRDSGIDIENLDDPALRKHSIGVFQNSSIRQVLARHGIKNNVEVHYVSYNADLVKENQPWRQVQEVADGKLDIAAAWGPFAGYVNARSDGALVLKPVNTMEDQIPLEYSLAIGMRQDSVLLKYALDYALKHSGDEIKAILDEYDVPLVQCSECIVAGDLPSHGSYAKSFADEAPEDRFLKPFDANLSALDDSQASPDQIVDEARVQEWLEEGADPDVELANAVTGSDADRIRFLVQHGADPNALNNQGEAPLHIAARNRDSETIKVLLDVGAKPDLRDQTGWTPLMYAAFRNHVPSVKVLIAAGADTALKSPEGITALGLATGEGKFWAAKALIEDGAAVDLRSGDDGMTPLMLVATHQKSEQRDAYLEAGMEPTQLSKLLLSHGADVNAHTDKGITALMIAAAYDNSPMIGLLIQSGADPKAQSDAGKSALDIAEDNGADNAEESLELFERVMPTQPASAS